MDSPPMKANKVDTFLNSLMDSTASPKMKTTERGVGTCSLAHNTLGVEGRVGTIPDF
jgi:hypothetical protein